MKIELLVGTRYKGEFRPAGKKLDVFPEVGIRWCKNNIAKSKEEEAGEDDSIPEVCNEGSTSDLLGDDCGEPSGEHREIDNESKRTDSSGNNGKNRNKGKRSRSS